MWKSSRHSLVEILVMPTVAVVHLKEEKEFAASPIDHPLGAFVLRMSIFVGMINFAFRGCAWIDEHVTASKASE
jgi:hypothetical protein